MYEFLNQNFLKPDIIFNTLYFVIMKNLLLKIFILVVITNSFSEGHILPSTSKQSQHFFQLANTNFRSPRSLRELHNGDKQSSEETDVKETPMQENVICKSGSKFEIVGSVFLNRKTFAFFIFDPTGRRHLALVAPAKEVAAYAVYGTISLKGTSVFALTDVFSFDPVVPEESSAKPQIISHVSSREGPLDKLLVMADPLDEERGAEKEDKGAIVNLLLFFYDPAQTKDVDAIVAFQEAGNDKSGQIVKMEHRRQTMPEYERKEVNILNDQMSGLFFVQCGGDDKGEDQDNQNWCVRDIEWKDGQPWFTGNLWSTQTEATKESAKQTHTNSQTLITVVEVPIEGEKSSKLETVSLLFIDSKYAAEVIKKIPGSFPVRWRKLNGFIARTSQDSGGLVVLFADDYVYTFEDRFGSNRYLFSAVENAPEVETATSAFPYAIFTALKVPTNRYFSCDGSLFKERVYKLTKFGGSGSDEKDGINGRAALIYGLFMAHFGVATIMICVIVYMTASDSLSLRGRRYKRSSGSSRKRVRKGFRSTPPSERAGGLYKMDIKGSSSSRKSKSGSKSSSKSSKGKSSQISDKFSTSSKSQSKSKSVSGSNRKSGSSKKPNSTINSGITGSTHQTV